MWLFLNIPVFSLRLDYLSITESTSELFIQDSSFTFASALLSVSDRVDNFSMKATNVIDAVGRTKVKVASGKKRAPWRIAALVNELIHLN